MKKNTFSIFLLSFLFIFMSCSSGPIFKEEAWRESVTSCDPQMVYAEHRDENGVFFNPWMPRSEQRQKNNSFFFRKKMKFPGFDQEQYKPVENQYGYLADSGLDSISYAGHASFFIKIDGNTIITDPFFSNYALVVGKKIKIKIDYSKIPQKPVVLLSHNHYDHLDDKTIKNLVRKDSLFIVPLGLKNYFVKKGAAEVYELDWWQDVTVNSVKYTLLPAQHWSRRIGQGRNSTLWGGFMIEASKTIYFSGDSGYFIGFKEFGNRFDIDYALIGAGAYEPRWFMHYSHANVAEFFLAADDLRAKTAIPMHFGIISLSDEPLTYPLYEVEQFLEANPQYKNRIKTLRVGEYIEIPVRD